MDRMQTPSQTVGPFFHYGLFTQAEQNILVSDATQGQHIIIKGQVTDGAGEPVSDALLEIWSADSQGYYAHPADPNHAQADPHFKHFGRADSVKDGVYKFETIKPGSVPFDGVQRQAPHINMRIFSRGLLTHVYTRLYFDDESDANQADPILNLVPPARRDTLIAVQQKKSDLSTYYFNVVLQGEGETVFFNP